MNVAFVSNVVYPFVTGGAQKRIHEIGTRLTERGHEVTVYGRHFWDGPQVMEYEGLTLHAVAPEAELYAAERRSISEAIGFSTRLVPVLRRRITEHDVVVASVFPYFPVIASEISSLGTEVPLVTTWHEVWLDYWTEYLGRLSVFGKSVERITARLPQLPTAVSGVTADRLARIGPPRSRIEVVPNGIDVARISNVTLTSGTEYPDVIFAGRLIADKRVDLLLDSFDRVADRHDVTLGIIGDGPESDSLRKRASGLENADSVSFLGFLEEYETVLEYMRAAKVFASPSTREGFGITYAEAMAAGCIVIGAAHPESAASEVIGDAGYVVDPTVDAVSDALDKALSGVSPPTDPTEQARGFDWEAVTDQAESVYRRAVTDR